MKKHILEIIESESPIKRKHLLSLLHPFFPDLTDRQMRKQIEQLVKDGELIQSSAKGYSIIKNAYDMSEAVEYFKKKARAISIRANTIIKNWNAKNKDKQYELFN